MNMLNAPSGVPELVRTAINASTSVPQDLLFSSQNNPSIRLRTKPTPSRQELLLHFDIEIQTCNHCWDRSVI